MSTETNCQHYSSKRYSMSV